LQNRRDWSSLYGDLSFCGVLFRNISNHAEEPGVSLWKCKHKRNNETVLWFRYIYRGISAWWQLWLSILPVFSWSIVLVHNLMRISLRMSACEGEGVHLG